MLDLLYFAWVRECVGRSGEQLDRPTNVRTVLDLANWLATRGDGYAEAFAEPSRLRCALDQHIVPLTQGIGDAREVAFFPPVTGG